MWFLVKSMTSISRSCCLGPSKRRRIPFVGSTRTMGSSTGSVWECTKSSLKPLRLGLQASQDIVERGAEHWGETRQLLHPFDTLAALLEAFCIPRNPSARPGWSWAAKVDIVDGFIRLQPLGL